MTHVESRCQYWICVSKRFWLHITSCRNHHGKGFLDFGFLINMLSEWKQTNIGDTNSTCLLKQRKPRCHVCSKIARLLACFNRRLHFGDGKNFRYHFVTTNRCEQCLATKLRENVHYHNGYLNEMDWAFPPHGIYDVPLSLGRLEFNPSAPQVGPSQATCSNKYICRPNSDQNAQKRFSSFCLTNSWGTLGACIKKIGCYANDTTSKA